MKKIIALSQVFALLGCAILVGSLYFCFTSLSSPAIMVQTPDAALECSENFMIAIEDGDFQTASRYLHGQVDLGLEREPGDDVSRHLWDAFKNSITCEFIGDCYATTTGVARAVRVTTLDPASVNGKLAQRVDDLLDARIIETEDPTEIYDESGEYREGLLDQLFLEALDDALEQDAGTRTQDIQLNLIYQNNRWWVVPDAALIQAISGGVAG